MASDMSGRAPQDLSNGVVYNLILQAEARLSQHISHLSARLDSSMQEIRSLVISALYPTGQAYNNSSGGLGRSEESFQQDDPDRTHTSNYSAPNSFGNVNHSSVADETYSTTSGNGTSLETRVDTNLLTPCGTYQSSVRDPLASNSSSVRDESNEEYGIGGETPISPEVLTSDGPDGNKSNSRYVLPHTPPLVVTGASANITTDGDEYEDDDVIFVSKVVRPIVAGPSTLAVAPTPANDSSPANSTPLSRSFADEKKKRKARRKQDKRGRITKATTIVQPGTSRNFAKSSPLSTSFSGKSAPKMVRSSYKNANKMQNVVVKKEPHYCTRERVSETGETRIECVCGYYTNNKVYMKRHTKANSFGRFRCPRCPALLSTCNNVRNHLVKDHKLRRLPTRLFTCTRCYKVFLKKKDKDGHKNERNHICKSRRDRLRNPRIPIRPDHVVRANPEETEQSEIRTPSFTISTGLNGGINF